LSKIFESYKEHELSYFEMNLETWRQLWRVLEISDIILLIVDIRFPALHFSPKFYEHCTNELRKDVILILNKIDLVPTSLVIAWKHYFEQKYPNLHIILFSSSKQIKYRQKRSVFGKDRPEINKQQQQPADQMSQQDELEIKALTAEIHTARAHRQLYECVKKIVHNNVDLSSWANLTDKQLAANSTATPEDAAATQAMDNLALSNEDTQVMNDLFNSNVERKKFEHGFVTIGCCGFPNVGKSSLLNSLNGRKVVSVSRTPGHTKHLQTIFLTKTVRLCDCPGLVFPSLINKPLQVKW
jgi:ribosome biogenesis GTPase A